MGLREYQKGEVIIREGEQGRCLYDIQKGRVRTYSGFGSEWEKQLRELGSGQIFGETAMLDGCARAETIVAVEPTFVREIEADTIWDFFKAEPGEVRKIMAHLSHRLREVTDAYEEASRRLGGQMPPAAPEKPTKEIYRRGQIIFREGEVGNCMYFITSGRVGIYTGYGTDQEKLLAELTEEQFFGEMGMIERLPRSATAICLEDDTSTELIYEENLDEAIKNSPAMIFVALQHLSTRLKAMTDAYDKVTAALDTAK